MRFTPSRSACLAVYPYGIVLTYSSTTGLCIPSGTYEGNVYTSVNTIVFDGPACRGFQLLRLLPPAFTAAAGS
jgi:hypothetical protein